jgi:Ca2+-binding RTX toxin-like protein
MLRDGGADTLLGDAGANDIRGFGGNDTITGGGGSDRVFGGAGADAFVLNSLAGSDTISDFASGVDKIRVSMRGIAVGDGDTVIDGAVSRSGPGGFAPGAELVVITGNIAGSLSASSAAAKIGSASSAYAAGDKALFAVDNGSASALYLFTSAGDDAVVSAAELKLLATLSGTSATAVGDYLFGT